MTRLLTDVIESHYLETHEGLFFAVKGLVHPPDRFFAILRYAPDESGDRWKAGQRYRRLYHFAEQEQFLRARYPHYLAFDPVCQAVLQSVPHACIRRVYDPRRRLQELAQQEHRDGVEEDALAFARLLQEEAAVPWTALGVSGSLLLGLHTPQSDLDISVYGSQNCYAVWRALKRLLSQAEQGITAGLEVRPLDPHGMEALYAERLPDTHMGFADFIRTESQKVMQGQFRHRPYFIRFLKAPAEVDERYGDVRYRPLGRAGIAATVADASEAIFTPCRYTLTAVRFLDSAPEVELALPPTEIVSYRGRFCEQARTGDTILAFGTLERVQARDGRTWCRLLLGNRPDDSMILTEAACER
jgi:predicted nucleotidyltransferase